MAHGGFRAPSAGHPHFCSWSCSGKTRAAEFFQRDLKPRDTDNCSCSGMKLRKKIPGLDEGNGSALPRPVGWLLGWANNACSRDYWYTTVSDGQTLHDSHVCTFTLQPGRYPVQTSPAPLGGVIPAGYRSRHLSDSKHQLTGSDKVWFWFHVNIKLWDRVRLRAEPRYRAQNLLLLMWEAKSHKLVHACTPLCACVHAPACPVGKDPPTKGCGQVSQASHRFMQMMDTGENVENYKK